MTPPKRAFSSYGLAGGLVLGAAAMLSACTSTEAPPTESKPAASANLATATLASADGALKGTAAFVRGAGDQVVMQLDVSGLTPGEHGAHLHAVGRCDAPDFASAGGHLNPHGKQHGRDNPQGAHLGDLPNLVVGADGKGALRTPLAEPWTAIAPQLFDTDGTAIVVHAGPDDYRSDPAGNSGGRVACGVVKRS